MQQTGGTPDILETDVINLDRELDTKDTLI